jgi:hypothetical protein
VGILGIKQLALGTQQTEDWPTFSFLSQLVKWDLDCHAVVSDQSVESLFLEIGQILAVARDDHVRYLELVVFKCSEEVVHAFMKLIGHQRDYRSLTIVLSLWIDLSLANDLIFQEFAEMAVRVREYGVLGVVDNGRCPRRIFVPPCPHFFYIAKSSQNKQKRLKVLMNHSAVETCARSKSLVTQKS